MKTHELFKNLLKEIEGEVSRGTYTTWFNDLELISIDDKEIKIKVPLQIHKQILKTTYYELLDSTMFSLTGIFY